MNHPPPEKAMYHSPLHMCLLSTYYVLSKVLSAENRAEGKRHEEFPMHQELSLIKEPPVK